MTSNRSEGESISKQSKDTEAFKDIMPTAWLTAYPKTFSDIPYAKELFEGLEKTDLETQNLAQNLKVSRLAPEIEARFKLVTRLLVKTGIRQVLELAAGFSPRGLLFADEGYTFVELDLPGLMAKKRAVLQKIKPNAKVILYGGNALRMEDLEQPASHFERKPVAVIHEGLLRYLSFEEKAIVARNIHALLERFGGVWITPDITLKKLLSTQNKDTMPGKNEMLIQKTGRDYNKNAFQDETEAKKFFERFGFQVEQHTASEVEAELTSPQKLQLSPQEVKALIEPVRVYVMRITESQDTTLAKHKGRTL